jgi:hypothetical protein
MFTIVKLDEKRRIIGTIGDDVFATEKAGKAGLRAMRARAARLHFESAGYGKRWSYALATLEVI